MGNCSGGCRAIVCESNGINGIGGTKAKKENLTFKDWTNFREERRIVVILFLNASLGHVELWILMI